MYSWTTIFLVTFKRRLIHELPCAVSTLVYIIIMEWHFVSPYVSLVYTFSIAYFTLIQCSSQLFDLGVSPSMFLMLRKNFKHFAHFSVSLCTSSLLSKWCLYLKVFWQTLHSYVIFLVLVRVAWCIWNDLLLNVIPP